MTKSRAQILFSVLIAILMAFPVLSASAQDRSADNMDLVRDKMRADKKLLIADNMGLTQSEAKVFWPVYESYQKDQGHLTNRMLKLIEGYAKNYETMTDTVARVLVDAYLQIEADRLALRKAYLPKFRKVLPETKVARYYQMENKLQAIVSFELAENIPLIK